MKSVQPGTPKNVQPAENSANVNEPTRLGGMTDGPPMLAESEWATIRSLKDQGWSINKIAQYLGRHRNTVRHYARAPQPPCYPKRASKGSILDPFEEYLQERMPEVDYNCVILLDEIREQGYSGSIRTLRRYATSFRKRKILPEMPAPMVWTDPGEEFQMDWGEFQWEDMEGRLGKLYLFNVVLSYSRERYVEFTLDMKEATLQQCLINAFEFFGGVPSNGRFDNMITVVTHPGPGGKRELNEAFRDFSEVQGFQVDLCPIYWARGKGKVERSVRYVRQNLWPQLRPVDSVEELNSLALSWCNKVNLRVHGTTKRIPHEVLETEEKQLLGPVRPFRPYHIVARKVSKFCLVEYATNHYSVPHDHCGQQVKLKISGDRMDVMSNGELIRDYGVEPGRFQWIINPEDHQALRALVAGRLKSRDRRRSKSPPILIQGMTVQSRNLQVYEEVLA